MQHVRQTRESAFLREEKSEEKFLYLLLFSPMEYMENSVSLLNILVENLDSSFVVFSDLDFPYKNSPLTFLYPTKFIFLV